VQLFNVSCAFVYLFSINLFYAFQAMGRIHAILSDGTIVTDVEVGH